MRHKKSGAQVRKEKRKREEQTKQQQGALLKFISPSTSKVENDAETTNCKNEDVVINQHQEIQRSLIEIADNDNHQQDFEICLDHHSRKSEEKGLDDKTEVTRITQYIY